MVCGESKKDSGRELGLGRRSGLEARGICGKAERRAGINAVTGVTKWQN